MGLFRRRVARMKAFVMIILSTIFLPDSAMAKLDGEPVRVMAAPCEQVAKEVVSYLDGIGFGRGAGQGARTLGVENREGGHYTYKVKVMNEFGESASGFTYEIDMRHDFKTQACVVERVENGPSD